MQKKENEQHKRQSVQWAQIESEYKRWYSYCYVLMFRQHKNPNTKNQQHNKWRKKQKQEELSNNSWTQASKCNEIGKIIGRSKCPIKMKETDTKNYIIRFDDISFFFWIKST